MTTVGMRDNKSYYEGVIIIFAKDSSSQADTHIDYKC